MKRAISARFACSASIQEWLTSQKGQIIVIGGSSGTGGREEESLPLNLNLHPRSQILLPSDGCSADSNLRFADWSNIGIPLEVETNKSTPRLPTAQFNLPLTPYINSASPLLLRVILQVKHTGSSLGSRRY